MQEKTRTFSQLELFPDLIKEELSEALKKQHALLMDASVSADRYKEYLQKNLDKYKIKKHESKKHA